MSGSDNFKTYTLKFEFEISLCLQVFSELLYKVFMFFLNLKVAILMLGAFYLYANLLTESKACTKSNDKKVTFTRFVFLLFVRLMLQESRKAKIVISSSSIHAFGGCFRTTSINVNVSGKGFCPPHLLNYIMIHI